MTSPGSGPGGSGRGGTIAVDVTGVSKIFGAGQSEVRALDDVSVAIRENEFFTLLGPSGCGKTTLLRLVAGFEHASAGTIHLYGEDISNEPPYRRPVNTVFQSYALFPHLSVAQNIGFGLEMQGRPKAEVDAAVDEMLRMVRMEALRDRRTAQISGGQQQRVALARALAPRPKVLLLDEPLSALDFKLRKEMQIELKRLQHETGITFIFVTHDQEEALTMSDRIAVMNEGRILQIGSPREIYEQPANRFVAGFIGDTNLLEAQVLSAQAGRARLLIAAGEGGGMELEAPAGAVAPGRSALSVMVRPEHVGLAAPGTPHSIPATVIRAVYFGTDTHYHLRLASGESLTARQQNRGGAAVTEGEAVGVTLREGAVRVLDD